MEITIFDVKTNGEGHLQENKLNFRPMDAINRLNRTLSLSLSLPLSVPGC